MKLETLAGTTEVDPGAATTFLSRWFNDDDLVTVVGVREKKPNQPHLLASVYPARDLIAGIRYQDGLLDSLVNGDDGSKWNLYVQVCPAKAELASPKMRGGDENVRAFRGIWVDLDVKPGGFRDEEHALDFLRGLNVWPTMIVATGTGGVHAYWRLEVDLDPQNGREFARGWWAYLAEEAAKINVSVDKLVDIARMMRLPGTIRWPKKDDPDGTVATQVRLLYSGGPNYLYEDLAIVCAQAAARRAELIKKVKQTDQQRRLNADDLAKTKLEANFGHWQMLKAIAAVEDVFNDMVTWDEILEPYGWTYLKTDSHDRREWARPGRMEKSATTDYPESPDVMSLLSWSDETGLFDLKEAGIALTKYRVAQRLWFNDDETKLVEWTLERMTK